jgi:hypothetical protein
VKAFGRDVAVEVLGGIIVVILSAVNWTSIAPAVAARFSLSFREAFAWGTAAVALIALAAVLPLKRKRDPAATPVKPASVTLSLNNGTKPSVTLTNHGGATTYRVDGRIVEHVDGTQSSQPAPFRCYLQVGGTHTGLDVLLQDKEWANIIIGDFEDVFPPSKGLTPVQAWTPVSKAFVIRRGKMGQHVRVPDTGAIVELTIKATPPLTEPIGPRLFRIVRNGDVATITHVAAVK